MVRSKLANNPIINDVNKEQSSLINTSNAFNLVRVIKEQQKSINNWDF